MTTDPTRTKTLRGDFSADVYSRFRSLKGSIRTAVEEEDVLNLSEQEAVNDTPDPREFQFLTDSKKRERFLEWLRNQIEDEILEPAMEEEIKNGDHWTATYVRTAYGKGIEHIANELRKQGVDVDTDDVQDVFNKPIHVSKLERLYTRVYENLKDITEAMAEAISEVLTKSLAKGWNPRKAARKLNDRIDKIGIHRARLLARTEIIFAHAEGSLDRLERGDFDKVTADVEHETADDDRVCAICEELDGEEYSIDEARGTIPVHPNCRCTWLPIIDISDDD